jgi:MoaA/NifB/PqqE/SkfB family radical SAM enzyme
MNRPLETASVTGLAATPGQMLASPSAFVPLFRHATEAPLLVACNCPLSLCNYRCDYCYLDHEKRDHAAEQRKLADWNRLIDRIVEIPRPLLLALGTVGEPVANQAFWDTLRRVSPLEHVRRFWFPSNLSRPLEPLTRGVDVAKLGVTASLHPSEFRNHDRDFRFFLDQCRWIVDRGGDVVVNFILTPAQIPLYPAYRFAARERGLATTVNVFKGEYQGRTYPEAYTPEEHERIREYLADRPIVHEYMSGKSSRGVDCTAGRDMITVELDGRVLNCPFAREPLGSIFDPNLQVRAGTSPCSTAWCACHWTIGMMSSMVARFRRTRGILTYEERESGAPAVNAFQ